MASTKKFRDQLAKLTADRQKRMMGGVVERANPSRRRWDEKTRPAIISLLSEEVQNALQGMGLAMPAPVDSPNQVSGLVFNTGTKATGPFQITFRWDDSEGENGTVECTWLAPGGADGVTVDSILADTEWVEQRVFNWLERISNSIR